MMHAKGLPAKLDEPLKNGDSISGTIKIGNAPFSSNGKSIEYRGAITQKQYGGYILLLMHREYSRGDNPYAHSEIPLNGLGRSSLMKKLERHLYSKYHEQFSIPPASKVKKHVDRTSRY